MAKKNPYIFTVGFNSRDPAHVKVVQLLNQQGKGYIAPFLVKAVLSYIGEGIENSSRIDISLLEPMIEKLLDEKLELIKGKWEAASSQEQLYIPKVNPVEGNQIPRTEAIMESLAAFRKHNNT